jgi:protoporphyrinogen oxidase
MNGAERVETLIVGAGPAGMAAAMELDKAGRPFEVVEKNDGVGGLSRTYVIKEGDLEFRTDNGPHRFFSKNPYLYEFIGGLLDERWIKVRRQTRQYIDGKFFDYPVDAKQVLKNLGLGMVARVLFDYAAAVVKYRWLKAPVRNFKDFSYASFGKTLSEFNIINYTEKVWGVPTERLHKDWAGQRIKGLNVTSVALNTLRKVLGARGGGPKSLVDEFYYPETGTGLIYETIKAKIEKDGHRLSLRTRPVKVRHDGSRIVSVRLEGPEGAREVEIGNLIESVHLVDFLKLLDPPPPAEVMAAAARLKYRSQVYLFLTLDKERVTDDQWIYFPKPEVPFERWSEMRNFSPRMSPPGKTSLFIEFFCFEDDPKWTMTADQLLDLVLPIAEKKGFFARKDVRRAYRFQGGKDYPIYDLEYKDNLDVIKRWLDRFGNLYYVGRPGRFKYTNQDHSLEMGMLAAFSVIEGERRDLEAVGGEKEYFEKGSLPPLVDGQRKA